LTGYEVAFREMSATDLDDWSTLLVDSPSINTAAVNNLSLFVTYEFKVRTVNGVGFSAYSLPLTLYTELGLCRYSFLSFVIYLGSLQFFAYPGACLPRSPGQPQHLKYQNRI